MKITSWNVNSVKQRLDHVERWVNTEKPDFLLIQELKGLEFPEDAIKAFGYESVYVSQKGRNGVAILSKKPAQIILESLPGLKEDEPQARYLEIDTREFRLINIYAPNGNPVDTEKYPYKLSWMKCLKDRLQTLRNDRIPFVIGGDFNIIPEDKDCHDPAVWINDALFKLESRQIYRSLLNLGLTEAFRALYSMAGKYTFWDYQAGAWPKNNGIRIDHFLLSPVMADRLTECVIDSSTRAWEKPSDHVPISVILS